MKREIICKPCGDTLKLPTYSKEHWKLTSGEAKGNYKCDHWGCDIKQGQDAFALSIWADYKGVPYYFWEPEYLKNPRLSRSSN